MNKASVTVLIVAAVLTVVVLIIIIVAVAVEPQVVTYPWNGIIRIATKRKSFYSDQEIQQIYPESIELEKNYSLIRKELIQLLNNGYDIPKDKKDSVDEGWSCIVLRAYGKDIDRNMKLCPILSSIVQNSDRTVTCFFSAIKPGKRIPPQTSVFGGLLRYHLALTVPKDKENCWIRVHKEKQSWQEGKGILFDQLYKHEVYNDTDDIMVVLVVDVWKPLPSTLNWINKKVVKIAQKSKKLSKKEFHQDTMNIGNKIKDIVKTGLHNRIRRYL